MKETVNCVRCGKQATIWGGHVIKPDRTQILAGWCERCLKASQGYSGR